jgi:hypothetical protein
MADRSHRTKHYINNDSEKYIPRSGALEKSGSRADGTDAAHLFGWGMMNVIETNSAGRAQSDAARRQLRDELNAAENLRIKTDYGNRSRDEWRDGRIADAYVNGGAIMEQTTAARAYQAYQGASTLSNQKYAQEMGNMRVFNPQTGGYYMVKNYGNYH